MFRTAEIQLTGEGNHRIFEGGLIYIPIVVRKEYEAKGGAYLFLQILVMRKYEGQCRAQEDAERDGPDQPMLKPLYYFPFSLPARGCRASGYIVSAFSVNDFEMGSSEVSLFGAFMTWKSTAESR